MRKVVVSILFAVSMNACGGDDAGPADAPGDQGAMHKRVFVTSTTYSGDLATASGTPFDVPNAGVAGANKLCVTAATARGLGGNWIAILQQPNGGLDAVLNVGPWHRLDGMLAFNNRAQLKTTPSVAVNVDELGNSQSGATSQCVWTGLQAGGAPLPGCALSTFGIWTFGNSAQNGVIGDLDATDSTWIYNGDTACNTPCHLYCLEQ